MIGSPVASALRLAVEEEDIQTGPIGLVIILLMLVATFFLIRNMNTRIKRLPPSFDDERASGQPTNEEPEGRG